MLGTALISTGVAKRGAHGRKQGSPPGPGSVMDLCRTNEKCFLGQGRVIVNRIDILSFITAIGHLVKNHSLPPWH